jgi:hypothetical protein
MTYNNKIMRQQKLFSCHKCERIFNLKQHLDNHLNKKNPCDRFLKNKDIDIDKDIDNFNENDNDKENNIFKNLNNNIDKNMDKNKIIKKEENTVNPPLNQNNSEIPRQINAKTMREYLDKCQCIYCEKKFTQKCSVLYHIKNNCKRVKEIEAEKHKIFEDLKKEEDDRIKKLEEENQKLKTDAQKFKEEMEKKFEELKKDFSKNPKNTKKSSKKITANSHNVNSNNNVQIDNSIHNQNNLNNQQQNIYIVDYNKEDLDKIDKDEILAIMKRGFQAPVELTRTIHFNPKYPEFHNIYIPRINERNGMVLVSGKWRMMNRNELVEDVYENKRDYIIQNMNSFMDKLDENKKKSLKRWLDRDNNDESIKNTKSDIKMLLFNNRHMVMDRKKEFEKIEKKKKLDMIKKNDLPKYKIKDKNSDTPTASNYDYDYESDSSNNSYKSNS